MARLRDQVADRIRDHALWQPGERVAVAVSGGLDSVVLLHLLQLTQGRHLGLLSVATLDHGTRGESASDADFVASLALESGLELHRKRVELGPDASEAACRSARLAFFRQLDVAHVALAHHRDDQVETVLMRMLRGSGTRGLAGMAYRREHLVRPLLDVSRQALFQHARSHGLRWREDPTNRDPRFLRNRVRHELVPLLEGLRPGALSVVARTAHITGEESTFLDAEARRRLPCRDGVWSRSALSEAPPVLVRRALLLRLPQITARQIDAILGAIARGSGVVHLSVSSRVRIDRESVSIHVEP